MIDIQGELLQIKQQREQKYISIVELLDFLKKQSPNSSFKNIAKWLLVKLELNDSRNVDIFSHTDYQNWEYEYEIPNFCVPLEIEEKPVELSPSTFFDALKGIDVVPLFGRGNTADNYLPMDKSDIYLERARIEKFLGFSTINNASNEIFIEKNCAIEKAQNTQLQAENERLKAENVELKAQLKKNEQQSYTTSKNPLEEDYIHPTKEETYQHLIYALTMGRANKDFFPMAYFTSKGHLKPFTVINDLLRDLRNSDIDGLNEQAMRKRLAEILKMEDLKAE